MTQLIIIENQSSLIHDSAIQTMIPDWITQLNMHLRAFWTSTPTYDIKLGRVGAVQGAWGAYFQDGLDIKTDLGYHDDDSGVPTIRIDCQAAKQFGYSVSEIASHEFCETAVDPNITSVSQGAWGTALTEVCDPFVMPWMSYKINGTEVANFATPQYWGLPYREGTAGRLDMKGMLKPSQVFPYGPPGAYSTVMAPGTDTWQVKIAGDQLQPSDLVIASVRASMSLRVNAKRKSGVQPV